MSPSRIACVWLPNWPIQRIVVAEPELRCQRVILFQTDSRRGRLVVAASPLAMRAGIRAGMPLSEAKSLLNRATKLPDDGDFHIFEHHSGDDLAAIEELADSLEKFSPIVGTEQLEASEIKRGQQPVSIFLNISGLARLFGGESQLLVQVFQHVQAQGYLSRIAIANTVGVAWGASRFLTVANSAGFGLQLTQPKELMEQTNSANSIDFTTIKQNGFIIPPDNTFVFSQLPIETLRLEPSVVATLHQLGIETNDQLLRLPRADLAMRFGNAIHRRLDQATGKIAEPVIARHRPPEFQSEQLLEYPTDHRETIEVIMGRLMATICEQLRARQQGALQWTVRMLLVDEPPLDFTINLFQPTAILEQIMPLVEMQLEQILNANQTAASANSPFRPPTSDSKNFTFRISHSTFKKQTHFQVQEIHVTVSSCVLLVEQQRQLFDENPRLDKLALAQLINRLTARLGAQNVLYPKLQSGYQPEYSFRMLPLVDQHRKRSRRRTKPKEGSHVAARPLRIFRPAVEVTIEVGGRMLEVGSDADGKREVGSLPVDWLIGRELVPHESITVRSVIRKTQMITKAWGPERIETGWWRGRTVCRDYWRVETDLGQQLWIFRDLREQRWFVQGEF